MRAKTLAITTICLVVSALSLPAVSHAKNGGSGSSSTTQTRVAAELTPACPDAEPGAEGKARRDIKTRNAVVWSDQFMGHVEVSIPNGLGITDPATADIRLKLSKGPAACPPTPYAECRLVLDEVEVEEEDDGVQTKAEYVVRVRMERGILRMKGTCDSAGVPDVMAGDVATATLVVDPTDRTMDMDFLQGTFSAH